MKLSSSAFAQHFDHTILLPNIGEQAVVRLCEEAEEYQFFSVCLNPIWVSKAARFLVKSQVKVCAVCGFPLGASTTATKCEEARRSLGEGASEVDMVISIGHMKTGAIQYVQDDIAAVKMIMPKDTLKVIIETCLLTDEEKVAVTKSIIMAGADFVKTSTGFSTAGATVEDVQLLKKTSGDDIRVKASGGIRTLEKAMAMLEAGADRIGSSNTVSIMQEYQKLYG